MTTKTLTLTQDLFPATALRGRSSTRSGSSTRARRCATR